MANVKAAIAATLAWAPPAPNVLKSSKSAFGERRTALNLTRGESGYGAVLGWKEEGEVTDLAGFAVVSRDSIQPYWEREVWAGMEKAYRPEDVSIDNLVLGVKAVDQEDHESPVSVDQIRRREVETLRSPGDASTQPDPDASAKQSAASPQRPPKDLAHGITDAEAVGNAIDYDGHVGKSNSVYLHAPRFSGGSGCPRDSLPAELPGGGNAPPGF